MPTQAAIAPYWDDLYDNGGGHQHLLPGGGLRHSEHLVVQWNDQSYYADSVRAGGVTLEAVLNLDGSMRFNYKTLLTGNNNGTNDGGVSATVGIKDAGTQGANRLLVSYDATNALVGPSLSILITPQPTTPDIYAFTVTAAETDTLAVTSLNTERRERTVARCEWYGPCHRSGRLNQSHQRHQQLQHRDPRHVLRQRHGQRR